LSTREATCLDPSPQTLEKLAKRHGPGAPHPIVSVPTCRGQGFRVTCRCQRAGLSQSWNGFRSQTCSVSRGSYLNLNPLNPKLNPLNPDPTMHHPIRTRSFSYLESADATLLGACRLFGPQTSVFGGWGLGFGFGVQERRLLPAGGVCLLLRQIVHETRGNLTPHPKPQTRKPNP